MVSRIGMVSVLEGCNMAYCHNISSIACSINSVARVYGNLTLHYVAALVCHIVYHLAALVPVCKGR
jgi:hypothetical protein